MKRVLWIALIVLGAMSCKKEDEVAVEPEQECGKVYHDKIDRNGQNGVLYIIYVAYNWHHEDEYKETYYLSKDEYEKYPTGEMYCK